MTRADCEGLAEQADSAAAQKQAPSRSRPLPEVPERSLRGTRCRRMSRNAVVFDGTQHTDAYISSMGLGLRNIELLTLDVRGFEGGLAR